MGQRAVRVRQWSHALRRGAWVARVLVVDDHVPARSLLRAILTLDRHEVVEASGGRSAIEIMIREPFDLIILDLLMPDVDGYEVLQAIRTCHERAKTPAIVVSAADEPGGPIRTAEPASAA